MLARLSLALALGACAGGSVPAETAAAHPAAAVFAASADTARGTLLSTGSEPGVIFVLQDAAGGVTVLEGDRALLRRVDGLEVAVGGTRGPNALRVERLAVRASGCVAAVEGVLRREDGRDLLELRDGRRVVVARLPQALRGMEGAWIWLAGPLDGDIDSFGVVADPPA